MGCWKVGVQSIYTRECVFGEIRTGLTVIITNIHQSVGTTPDVKFRWNGLRECVWVREKSKGTGERATATAFMRLPAGGQGVDGAMLFRWCVRFSSRSVFSTSRYSYISRVPTHTHIYIHIYLNKYMYIIYTRRILRICNIFENVEYEEFLHFHPKPMLLKYILYT